MAIKIRNWHKFQHFKDRKPPWIKLYRDILDDILWHELESDAAKCLISFWLIASEHDGYLPTTKELAFRLRTTEKSIKSNISKLSTWLEQDDITTISDITPISSGYQEARLETERETETYKTEGEIEASPRGSRLSIQTLPTEWKEFAIKERPDLNPEGVFENFRDWWTAAAGSKGIKADWLATWRIWVRNQKSSSGVNKQLQLEARNRAAVAVAMGK